MKRLVGSRGGSAAAPSSRARSSLGLFAALALGGLIAGWWFVLCLSLPAGDRYQGDAYDYFSLMMQWDGIVDAFHQVKHRSLGFPLILYAIRTGLESVGVPVDPNTSLNTFLTVAAAIMFTFHLAATLVFFVTARSVLEEACGIRLHPAALVLLLVHPGLVAYTTVLLTDTLTADLFMLAWAALVLGMRARSLAGRTVGGLAFGLGLGLAVLVRPSSLVVLVVFLIVAGALALRDRTRVVFAVATLACAATVSVQVIACSARFGRTCLVDPAVVGPVSRKSIGLGSRSARLYWSRYSADPAELVVVEDPLFMRTVAPCKSVALTGDDAEHTGFPPLLRCLGRQPAIVPAFVAKKVVGLFDTYHMPQMAADRTTRWQRLYNRFFAALAFAGFASLCGWLVPLLVRWWRARERGHALLALAAMLAIGHIASHTLLAVEPRYGLPAVAFALVALVATLQTLPHRRRAVRAIVLSGMLVAAGAFLVQTHWWDEADPLLRKIEGCAPEMCADRAS